MLARVLGLQLYRRVLQGGGAAVPLGLVAMGLTSHRSIRKLGQSEVFPLSYQRALLSLFGTSLALESRVAHRSIVCHEVVIRSPALRQEATASARLLPDHLACLRKRSLAGMWPRG
jgi:hypothetical protein